MLLVDNDVGIDIGAGEDACWKGCGRHPRIKGVGGGKALDGCSCRGGV